MDNVTFNYKTEDSFVEGTPERPSRPRYAWLTEQANPTGSSNDQDQEIFILVQRVVGSFERAEDLEEFQTRYVPRSPNFPPIQKITQKYLDSSGSFQDDIRTDRSDDRR